MKYPYIKCNKGKKRVAFNIEMPDNARLEYESKKGVKFQIICPACRLEDTYRASEVHFL